MNLTLTVIIVTVLGLALWVALKARQPKIEAGCFVFVKGDSTHHRWFVYEVVYKRALIVENAGAYGGRWVDVKTLRRVDKTPSK